MVFKFLIIIGIFLNLSCYRKHINFDEIKNKDIKKIRYTYNADIVLESGDKKRIKIFFKKFINVNKDESSDDFKSFHFIYLESDSNTYILEILGDRFRINGIRYNAGFNIKETLDEIFKY